ncbi:histone-like nucleoid-structuring protein, MvaT/MvaU family [Kushneria indalinina]|uniref:MvaT DNA-binding domain-containing protein n=1 Tax=Kushneria indalinina DSM 14324 TaxID=1122140 RepID=A0A3D9DRI7_9GAMM|nr:histone-like nucleoid-structuring protein, MvaT/MvaU family [Kushneria indalinina]REC93320.1 hypothetical protein C8D72_3478 [Kushneria indalinina DSM 14324]
MTKIAQYLEIEKRLKELQSEMEAFHSDEKFQDDLKFKSALEELCNSYNRSHDDAIVALGGHLKSNDTTASDGSTDGRRKKRKLKKYKNPHTDEIVETRGGNQKTLKAWRDEYGADVVESWLQE